MDVDMTRKFFWFDLCESQDSGSLFMFGKILCQETNEYASCCVEVRGAKRVVLFLLNQGVGEDSARAEISILLNGSGIKECEMSLVSRRYAFMDDNVPEEGLYIEAVYSSVYPQISNRMKGVTFSRTFGVFMSPVDIFVLARSLMGPSWITLTNVSETETRRSWCSVNLQVESMSCVTPDLDGIERPCLSMLSLSLILTPDPKTKQMSILAASGAFFGNVSTDHSLLVNAEHEKFAIICRNNELPFPPGAEIIASDKRMILVSDERNLLNVLLSKIGTFDPDIIAGHGLVDSYLGTLFYRLEVHNIQAWSKLGRLKCRVMPRSSPDSSRASFQEIALFNGRILCDVKICAREILRSSDTDLDALVVEHFGTSLDTIDYCKLVQMCTSVDGISRILDHASNLSSIMLDLVLKMDLVPLCVQISNVTGSLLAKVFIGSSSERNDFMLIRAFVSKSFVIPDKRHRDAPDAASNPQKKQASYTGGLVLEPKRGLYTDGVIVLDYESLYPSIIQEYNVCFTTISKDGGMVDDIETRGILPGIVNLLVMRRKAVKKLIDEQKCLDSPCQVTVSQLEIRQKALKLTANSVYGCLGFSNSRFYAVKLAEFIASKGRDLLTMTIQMLESQFMMRVIYGDTDSVMIDMMGADVEVILGKCRQFIKTICAKFTYIKIGIEHVFSTMLLLNKKRYAAVESKVVGGNPVVVRHVKGLDMVRRDWCILSRDVSSDVLDMILSGGAKHELIAKCKKYLCEVYDRICSDNIDLEKYVISKSITKLPDAYCTTQALPHVRVALLLQSRGVRVFKNDIIKYVICEDGTNNSHSKRSYPPSDLTKRQMRIDKTYYIESQIIPSVSRLFESTGELSEASISECFGIVKSEAANMSLSTRTSVSELVNIDLKPLRIICRSCKSSRIFTGLTSTDGNSVSDGMTCPVCKTCIDSAYMCNLLTLESRMLFSLYCSSELECTNQSCRHRMSHGSITGVNCQDPQCQYPLKRIYDWNSFRSQIIYFRRLFDAKSSSAHTVLSSDNLHSAVKIYEHATFIARKYSCGMIKIGTVVVRQ
jgi:DNA polymerase alpha subunit A